MQGDIQTLAIPASLRLKIYVLFSLLGLALSGTEVGYSTANAPQPLWLKIALAVFGFLSVAVGYTAASHTPSVNDPVVTVDPPAAPVGNANPVVIKPINPAPVVSPEGGFAAIGFIGIVLLLVGVLAIVGLFHLAFAISIVLIVVGLLLVLVDSRGTRIG